VGRAYYTECPQDYIYCKTNLTNLTKGNLFSKDKIGLIWENKTHKWKNCKWGKCSRKRKLFLKIQSMKLSYPNYNSIIKYIISYIFSHFKLMAKYWFNPVIKWTENCPLEKKFVKWRHLLTSSSEFSSRLYSVIDSFELTFYTTFLWHNRKTYRFLRAEQF
jgi:hypothetical protein